MVSVTGPSNGTNTTIRPRVYLPSGVTGSVVWFGAQLNELSFADSYIPTTTTIGTRNPDINSIPYAGNVPRGDQPFTFVFKGVVDGYTDFNRLFGTDTADTNKTINAFIDATGNIFFTDGSDSNLVQTAPITLGVEFTYIVTSDGINYKSYLNGALQNTSLVTSPATELPSELRVMRGASATNDSYGHALDFRIYDFDVSTIEVSFLSGE